MHNQNTLLNSSRIHLIKVYRPTYTDLISDFSQKLSEKKNQNLNYKLLNPKNSQNRRKRKGWRTNLEAKSACQQHQQQWASEGFDPEDKKPYYIESTKHWKQTIHYGSKPLSWTLSRLFPDSGSSVSTMAPPAARPESPLASNWSARSDWN